MESKFNSKGYPFLYLVYNKLSKQRLIVPDLSKLRGLDDSQWVYIPMSELVYKALYKRYYRSE